MFVKLPLASNPDSTIWIETNAVESIAVADDGSTTEAHLVSGSFYRLAGDHLDTLAGPEIPGPIPGPAVLSSGRYRGYSD